MHEYIFVTTHTHTTCTRTDNQWWCEKRTQVLTKTSTEFPALSNVCTKL